MTYSKASQDCPRLSRRAEQCDTDCDSTPWMMAGEQFTGCPLKTTTEQSFRYLEAYFFYDNKGHFPNPGVWREQPEKILQVFRIIESERAKIAREEAEEENDK